MNDASTYRILSFCDVSTTQQSAIVLSQVSSDSVELN